MQTNEKIRLHIKNKGLKLTAVSEKSGVEYGKLWRVLQNTQRFETEDYKKICDALEVSYSYFFEQDFS